MKIHSAFHLQLRSKFQQILDISAISKIPILNINIDSLEPYSKASENILDCMLYIEFIRNGVILNEESSFYQGIIREEISNPGYRSGFSNQFESCNSLILSIIEYKSFQNDASKYCGYKRQDFQVLRNFLKSIVIAALKQNAGARFILEKINYWLKKGSKFISSGLKEVIEVNHTKYLVNLISKLKEEKYDIVSVSKELIILGTDKKIYDACIQFGEYVKKKISYMAGYELLNFRTLRIFEKIGFIDPYNYYFTDSEGISMFAQISLPKEFLSIYFSEDEIKNETIYDISKSLSKQEIKILLKLLSYKRDVHGLAFNCYKLMKSSEFDENPSNLINLTIFCKKCGSENFIGKKCLKCYSEFNNVSIEQECIAYLLYCWKMQISGDKYCTKCGFYGEKRLKEYCRRGGKFASKDYLPEISRLKLLSIPGFLMNR